MKSHLLVGLILCVTTSIFAQNLWQDISLTRFDSPKKERISHPTDFRSVTLDVAAFMNTTRQLPKRTEANLDNTIIMNFPLPNGDTGRFFMYDAELMHPDLASKFPQLKSFMGKGIDDPSADLRITYSPYHGFNGMISSGKYSTVYIDPITKDHQNYMVYYRKDVERPDQGFQCHTQGADESHHRNHNHDSHSANRFGDCNLRRYRLAQSCTGEYAQYHITQAGGSTGTTAGNKAIVQSAMNVTMSRVNGVFEKDLGITMQFIGNNDDIIYLDGGTDPWTSEWNTKTAETIDAVIGVSNYDIGHNFNTTGGGNAGCLTCVCTSVSQSGTHKGRGYTGRSAPVGDPFDIDYVAHEMGHQYGGFHTQSNNSCRSGSGATEVEPGSASTIMGYAGICSANVQGQSDDYFHYVNIRDIVDAINNGVENTCAELIPSGNSSPTADAGGNHTIPISTPFVLTGEGSDPNDTGLTYCWEQNDPENPSSNAAPDPTRTVGPMFRSMNPTTVPYRYFPELNDIVNNNNDQWEVLPSVSRTMDFAFTVRDNNVNSGCTQSDLIMVTTDATSGPFLVMSPNTALTWDAGTTQNITWDVANTNAAPVNCSLVDIYLSTDGGTTFSNLIAAGVPNDGSEMLMIPGAPGNNNRIMIKCADNIFFDISDQDFTINSPGPSVDFTMPTQMTVTEGSSCTPKIISFSLVMSGVPSASTDVTIGVSGSALENDDFTLNATSFTFDAGNWNTPQPVILTIREDAVDEEDENIIIEIISVTGSNAVSGLTRILNFDILDDDIDPTTSGTPSTTALMYLDFESGFPGTWTRTGSASTFVSGTAATLSSTSWTVPVSNGTQMVASNDDACNCDMSNDVLTSESVTINSTITNLEVVMDIYFQAGTYSGDTESAQLEISKDGGATFPLVYPFSGATQWQSLNFDLTSELPSSGSETWVFRWVYNDGPGWTYGFAIDNIAVNASAPNPIPVHTTVNSGTSYAEHELDAGDIVHFYDQVTGDIMCTIDNSASAHGYGCVTVEVDRSGTLSVPFVNSPTNSYLLSKSFKITPNNNTASDPNGYTITMYFNEAEMTGWESETGESRNSTWIHKVDGDNRVSDVTQGNPSGLSITSTPATYANYGDDHAISATFTNGFSGFGVGVNISHLPVELLSFTGKHIENRGNELDWTTATEENTSHFEVEHSLDGMQFTTLGEVAAQGNSVVEVDYQFLDAEPLKGLNYYRLLMVDLDGSFEYSEVISIQTVSNQSIEISPNPTKGNLNLNFGEITYSKVEVKMYDLTGQLIDSKIINEQNTLQISVDIEDLPNGMYLIHVQTDQVSFSEKIMKM